MVYENQAAFQNSVTFDMTGAQVWGLFESYAAQVGVESNQFYSQMNNSTLTWQVTRNWKWAASKGVFATPSYLCSFLLLLLVHLSNSKSSEWRSPSKLFVGS